MAEPIDPAEANEPMLASEANEAALPTERTESWEQIERTEFSDQRDHTLNSVAIRLPTDATSHAAILLTRMPMSVGLAGLFPAGEPVALPGHGLC